ncbi:MAG: metallophosphoesterase, partial [Alteromonas sp.]|nr:metallophosphoesterase [Alteromonas sp.]
MKIKTNAISKAPLTKHLTIDNDKRVFVVGDLDGDYSRLKTQLNKVNFNPDEDTLISLG